MERDRIAKLIEFGAVINQLNNNGDTSIHHAIRPYHYYEFQNKIDKKAISGDAGDHLVAMGWDRDLTRFLDRAASHVQHALSMGADPSATDAAGETPTDILYSQRMHPMHTAISKALSKHHGRTRVSWAARKIRDIQAKKFYHRIS